MKSRSLERRRLALAVAAVVAAAGWGSRPLYAVSLVDDAGSSGIRAVGVRADEPARYIVRFSEPPLAMYNTQVAARGVAPMPLVESPRGGRRIDVQSAQAQQYVAYLQAQQEQHLSAIGAALGRGVTALHSMQHALNASVVELLPGEAQKVAALTGVAHVERDRDYAVATDIGPGFIGAPAVWWNAPAAQDTVFAGGFDTSGGFAGDGVVVGDIDTGYNSLSPSFRPTDAKGHAVANPRGHGHYFGQCGLPLISSTGCNDKVIGVYDEINRSSGASTAYTVEDVADHGSHTASTAAGDYRSATLAGYTHDIAGVAPHANLVIYRACVKLASGQSTCPQSATTAAVDDAVKDGVVDVLNFSISGGFDPWAESTSLAFLSAENAGIFVAAAAGNTSATQGQTLFSVNHSEPWVTTVAAGTHTGGPVAPLLTITAPGTPPDTVKGIVLTPGAGGVTATASLTAPIVLSPQFHITDINGTDGCAGYPANTFKASVALISRGTCAFSTKVNNAMAAGAAAVVIADNRLEGALSPSVPGTSIPAYTVTQAQGQALKSYLDKYADSGTVLITYPNARVPQHADELASFSLLGPGAVDVIKPDVQAPGVQILAAIGNDGSANGPNRVALFDGTSMATPHTAGAAALLMQAHPTWTPAQVKSALMLTAKEADLTEPGGKTPSNALERGAGRIQVDQAARAGLVMDENAIDFAIADPAAGGNPNALNLASLQDFNCVSTCTFTRVVTSSAATPVTWTVTGPGSITPASFTLAPGQSQALSIAFDTHLSSTDLFLLSDVVLTPNDPHLSPLHLPLSLVVPGPALAANPQPLAIAGVGDTTADAALTLKNVGGGTLKVAQSSAPAATYSWAAQKTNILWGQASTQYAAREHGASDYFAADDFTITGSAPVNLSRIYVAGFTSGAPLTSFGPNLPLHWRIYADNGGKPGGDPDDNGTALWSFDTVRVGEGVRLGVHAPLTDDIELNLGAAGAPPTALPAGHYWLVVYPTLPCLGTGAGCTGGYWYWLTSPKGSGAVPQATVLPPTTSVGWTALDPTTGKGLAMELESNASCSVPAWLSQTGLPTSLGAELSTQITVTADGTFKGPSATAYLCLDASDAADSSATPTTTAVQVNATR